MDLKIDPLEAEWTGETLPRVGTYMVSHVLSL